MNPGDVIDGKYRVEVQLGEGGMGVVVAATHLQLDNTVAIKVLKGDALKFPEVPRRFMREARAAGRLRSEHVVKVTDVGQLPSKAPYMVMEMLHGEDVSSQLKLGPLAVGLAVEYILQACEGLAEAHALGMIHRDVKPANLFVTRRPNGMPLVKLLDFGIATAAYGEVDHKLTTTQSVMGSPSYMSPEQLRAARDVDARSDIWSLGVTLYEMLSTQQPFVGPTLTSLTLAIVGDPHRKLEHIPPALMKILDRCLAKNREDRYSNVAELAQVLAPFAASGEMGASMVVGALSQPVAPTLPRFDTDSASFSTRRPPSTPARTILPTSDASPPMSTTSLGAGESAGDMPELRSRRGVWIGLGAFALVAIIVTAVIVRSTSSETPSANAATKIPDKVNEPTTTPTGPDTTTTPPPPKVDPIDTTDDGPALLNDTSHVRDATAASDAVKAIDAAKKQPPKVTTPPQPPVIRTPGGPEDPYRNNPPKKDPPKQDPPKKDPPKQDPPKKDPPKPCLPSDPTCGL